MTLSEELTWRGFVNQTTYKDITALDGEKPVTFYWGVDPSADSMTVGNLATAMVVKTFIKHGQNAVLLVGGATGMIGDPDGKSSERELLTLEMLEKNKASISAQYDQLFGAGQFKLVDNYDWFKDKNYLNFLRDVGKHVPVRQMLARDFVQSRLSEDGAGISYAEFSYVLVQAYDFLWMYENIGVTLQLCGSDQWGNSIAGVDLIRRKTGGEAHVYSVPLIVNPLTGQKFGKSEDGAIWLDPAKTTPTKFYQFWVNTDDGAVESYLKIFTDLDKPTIEDVMRKQTEDPSSRAAQYLLAESVTALVHGPEETSRAKSATNFMRGISPIVEANDSDLNILRSEIASIRSTKDGSIVEALVASGLATSNGSARRLINENAISINGQKIQRENFSHEDFQNGRLLLRRGKAFKDSALVESN
jgi:tyrosyl-tRNA synthetase